MQLQTNLVKRGSRFYYRARVPTDLKAHFGKTEFLISLKTSDRRQADHCLAYLKANLIADYARIRGSGFVGELQIASSPNLFTSASNLHSNAQERSKAVSPTLDSLIEYWASQSEKRPRTLMEVDCARRRLIAITKHNEASLVVKQHAIDLKDKLIAEGLSVPTIQKQINLLKAVFEVAVNNDLILANPFKGIRLVKPKTTQKSRIPFTADDLRLIFGSPIFSIGLRPFGGAGEAAIWLPRIALWTGMRLEEIGQLLVSDIGLEQDIHFINVTADVGSGKRLKTTSSNRRVPIHPRLIEAGFLDYVCQMKATGSIRLFPILKSAGNRQLTSSWSQWFSRYLRTEVGITDTRKTFHSFRHGFKEACRSCQIAKDIHDHLTGHASSDIGDGYGGDQYPLFPLATSLVRIEFDIGKSNSVG